MRRHIYTALSRLHYRLSDVCKRMGWGYAALSMAARAERWGRRHFTDRRYT